MSKQVTLSRWFRPAGQQAPAVSCTRDIPSAPADAPSRQTTLLDVLAELDIHALRNIVGHLEAGGTFGTSCSPVREACKALRDAVDTGAHRLRLGVPLDEDYVIPPGCDRRTWSPLLKWPSCTQLQLMLHEEEDWCGACGDAEEEEGEEEEEDEDEGMNGEDEQGKDGMEEEGAEGEGEEGDGGHGEAEQAAAGEGDMEEEGAAAEGEGNNQQGEDEQAEEHHGGAGQGEGQDAAGVGETATQRATRLLTWPFLELPPVRRAQITSLQLCMDSVPNMSHVLQALGPLLPCVQHLEVTNCHMSGWEVGEGECGREVEEVLAEAFPQLQSLTMDVRDAQRIRLGAHLGGRLTKLTLTTRHSQDAKVWPALCSCLSRMVHLKELVLKHLVFSWDMYAGVEEWDMDDPRITRLRYFAGGPGEVLDAVPPSVELLRLHSFQVPSGDYRVGKMDGCRLEVVLQGGKVQAVRVGWTAGPTEMLALDRVLCQSKLGKGGVKVTEWGPPQLPLLQMAGVYELGSKQVPMHQDILWPHLHLHLQLSERYKRFELGRLYVERGTSPKDVAVLVQLYRPEEVACDGCVVRLRGSGPPPSYERAHPLWRLELGDYWADIPSRWWGRPAPTVREVLAANPQRVQLQSATASDAKAVVLTALVRDITALRAAAAAKARAAAAKAGQGQGQGRGRVQEEEEEESEEQGGLALGRGGCGDESLLLLVGPFVRLLGPEPALVAWLKALNEEVAAAAVAKPGEQQVYRRPGEAPEVRQYMRVQLPQLKAKPRAPRSEAAVEAEAEGALLLQFDRWTGYGEFEKALAEMRGGCGGQQQQVLSSCLQVVRLRGSCLREELHDAYLSPVGVLGCGVGLRCCGLHGGAGAGWRVRPWIRGLPLSWVIATWVCAHARCTEGQEG